RYSGKLFNKTMLVEATAAYHRQRDNDVPAGVQGQSASALGDLPSISWRGTRNLLDPQLQDSTVPSSQRSAAVLQACAVQPNGFNPCPVTNYFDGGFGFAGTRTLDRFGGVLKLSNFVELLGHHQFKYGIDASRDNFSQSKTLDASGNPVTAAGINLTNVMPRVGLIYDFTGRGLSKVYGSYGRFYEYIPLDLADRSLSAETQVALVKDLSHCSNPADVRT